MIDLSGLLTAGALITALPIVVGLLIAYSIISTTIGSLPVTTQR
ncbi:MAG: hypothetical protein BMS9Abin02_1766 [Anaerolineae bacterium]|nr:MAG: hypothetical protein BMS9Abin02_1766 [Anaerolineae bacterium]